MTNPYIKNTLIPQQESTNPYLKGGGSSLIQPLQEEEDPNEFGFFHWSKNVVKNTAKMLLEGPSQYPLGEGLTNPLGMAWNDFKNWFGNARGFTGQDVLAAGKGLIALPFSPSRWGQVAKSLAELPVSFLEAGTGQNLGADNYTPLSPEQRSDRIKSAVGGAIAAVVTAGASKALNIAEAAAFTPKVLKDATKATTAELAMVKPAIGPLARGFAKGTIEAGVGGATYTGIARAGKEDVLVSTITNGLIFAPIGGAFQLVNTWKGIRKGDLPLPEARVQMARDLAYTRGLQFTEDQTFLGTVNNVEGLASGGSLAKSFVQGKLETDPAKSYIFDNITKEELPDIVRLVQAKGVKSSGNYAIHSADDGSYSVLFGGKNDISKTKRIFEQTGTAEGRIVSYDGADYRIIKVNPKSVVIVPLLESDGSLAANASAAGKKTVRLSDTKFKANEVFDIETISPETYTSQVFARWAGEVLRLSANKASKIEDAVFTDPVSYRGVLAKVAKTMGFEDSDLPSLSKKIEAKLGEYLKGTLVPEDRQWISKAEKNLNDYQNKLREDIEKGLHDQAEYLNEQAWHNGMFIDTESTGVINIRSSQDGRSIGKASTLSEALNYIRNSGQAETYSYGDDLKALPPNVPAPLGMPMYKEEWNMIRRNKYLGSLTDQIRARASLIFNVGDQIKSIDNIFKTDIYGKIFYPTQEVITRFYAANHRMEKNLDFLDKSLSKLTPDRRRVVNRFAQMDSPDDLIISGVRKGNPLSPEVQEAAGWLHKEDIDIGKVYEARRMILDNVKNINADPQVYNRLVNNLTDKEQLALGLFDALTQKGADEIPAMEAIRLANAMKNGELGRDMFSKAAGMSKDEIKLGHEIIAQYEHIKTQFGITDYNTLNNILDHFSGYIKNRKSEWLHQLSGQDARTKDFVNELAKLGMIDHYVDNPIDYLRNYIRVGNKIDMLNPVLATARETLDQLNVDFKNGKVNFEAPYNRIASYLSELEGIPDSSSQFTKAALEAGKDVFNFDAGKEGIDKLVRYLTGTVELSTQGLRPGQGVRDFYSAFNNYNIRFGFKRGQKWLGYFKDDKLADALLKQGDIIGLDINQFLSAGGLFEQGQAAKGFEKALQVGFKGTLQKPVHVRAQAAAFMETFKNAEGVLLDLSRNKITKQEAYKKLLLTDAYDPAVLKGFDAKVSSGKFYEAARMLAQESARETIGQYGAAYHPYKWNTTTGRLMGQFGQWSSMQLGYFSRLAGQGSLGYRYAALARWAAVTGATYTIEKSLGLNLSSWYMTPATMNFSGSPIVEIVSSGLSTSSASDYERKQGLMNLNRLIPFANENQIAQVYLPFSYATRDLIRAADDFSRGFYLQTLPQAIGIPTNQNETGLLDSALGNRPRLDY